MFHTQIAIIVSKILLFPIQYFLIGYLVHMGWNMYDGK
jgi:hypothetical protein